MVGLILNLQRIGTVAIFATLCVAIHVSGDKGCFFEFDNATTDFDLECNGLKNQWIIKDVEKDSDSLNKKALVLDSELDGCLKTKNTVVLNSTSKVVCKFKRDGKSEETDKFVIRLQPKEGTCPDEECKWNVENDPKFKPGQWVSAEYKFPLKATKEFYIQVQVGKSKGKLLLDHIAVPGAIGGTGKCHKSGRSADEKNKDEKMPEINYLKAVEGGGGGNASDTTESNDAPSLAQIGKNLMLTSVSVLTLKNLLN